LIHELPLDIDSFAKSILNDGAPNRQLKFLGANAHVTMCARDTLIANVTNCFRNNG
jgi:hypothetical protein